MNDKPAQSTLPYGRPSLDEDDIAAVVEVLRTPWLTTGPKVPQFERAVAEYLGAREVVALSSGTAALHAMFHSLDLHEGDEVIVPAMTFSATANAVVMAGGVPVFADVHPDTLLLTAELAERRITARTRAIIAVDYAGQPCEYDALGALAAQHKLRLLCDGCHALGARYRGRAVGTLAELTAFSLHPVKAITTGEGGLIATNDTHAAARLRAFRHHGLSIDPQRQAEFGPWYVDQVELGYNYRLSDFQCALGISQLKKLPQFIARRTAIAQRYLEALAAMPCYEPLRVLPDIEHAWHLFVVRLPRERWSISRREVNERLKAEGIVPQVHYRPVHLHTYYRQRFNTAAGQCPQAEAAYEQMLSLPLYPGLSDADVQRVLDTLSQLNKHPE